MLYINVHKRSFMNDIIQFDKTLIHEKETLQTILDNLADGVVVADKYGKLIYFNSIAENILGLGILDVKQEEWASAYGCYYTDGITPFPAEELPLAISLNTGQQSEAIILIKNLHKPNGIYINVNSCPLKDINGDLNGATAVFRDITDSKHAELRQEQSNDRIRIQFKGFPIPTYVWQYKEKDFLLVDFNDAAEIATNFKINNLIGIKARELYSDSIEIQEDLLQCYLNKEQIKREMKNRLNLFSEDRDFIVNYVFIPPDLIMVHAEDVTNRKKVEERLSKLSQAVEQTADSILITNRFGEIEYVNKAFEVTTGYISEEALGKTPKILKSGHHDKFFYKNMWEILLEGKPYRDTILNRKKNGDLYWCEQTITPMFDSDENIINFVAVLKDISDLKKKQEQEFQLKIASEIQKRFLREKVSIPGFDITGFSHPAVETSGDYFDFIYLPNGSLAIAVCDVSGHGFSSALIMAETRAYLRAYAKNESDPGILLTLLNQELAADLDDERYATFLLARLDFTNKQIDYANAGHLPIYILNKDGSVKFILDSTGIPLGIIHNYNFEKSQQIHVESGDIIVFLTDGVVEAKINNANRIGIELILDVIKENKGESSKSIVGKIYHTIAKHSKGNKQEDDITLIVCKVE